MGPSGTDLMLRRRIQKVTVNKRLKRLGRANLCKTMRGVLGVDARVHLRRFPVYSEASERLQSSGGGCRHCFRFRASADLSFRP